MPFERRYDQKEEPENSEAQPADDNVGYKQEDSAPTPEPARRPKYNFEDEGEIHIPSFLRKKS